MELPAETQQRRTFYSSKYKMAPVLSKNQKIGLAVLSNMNIMSVLEPADFRNYLRMDSRSFDILLNLVTPYIQKQNTVLRDSISAKQRLVVTLRFLATGNSYQDLKYSSLISQPMLSIIIPETCSAIYTCLEHYIKEPDYITRKWIDHENTSQGSIRHGDWRKHTDGLTSLKNTSKSQRNEEGNQVRNTFMNYFNSVGRVAFQDKMINAVPTI
ncbi:hypothetical protein HW555_004217 [Spodoptera exigua]|uniref:Uncharacterized protein n=1 Tax=Spodoptera exigua TaxID=7107 RepID=A0A835L8J0_SPOEX|nr:hypothetical protein HW555_004217 [Spodoptera exigua]